MKKLTLPLLLGVLVIGALVWGLMGPSADDGIDLTGSNGDSGTSRSGNPLTGGRDPDRNRTDLDPSRDGGDPGRDTVPTQKLTVRGRCVDAGTGLPLAGCTVDIAAARRQYGRQRQAETIAMDALVVRTAGDGRFEVEIDVPTRHQVRIRTKMDRRADMEGYLWAGREKVLDTGDIRIPAGTRLRATVVDEQGNRQPHISLRMHRSATGARGTITPLNWIDGKSDLSGIFETDISMAQGPWNVVAHNNVRLIEPRNQLVIPQHESLLQTKFVVKLPDPQGMITGSLQDEQGKPVPNIAIQATTGGPWPIGYGQTDIAGAFQVKCRTKPGEPVQLMVQRAVGYEPLTTSESYPWGSTDVKLTLVRAGDLRITVLAKDDDSPIEDYRAVWFAPNTQGSWYPGGRERMGHHPDGKSTIEGVPAGKIRIVILPRGKAFAPNEPHEFVKSPGRSEVRIELARRVDISVVVVGSGRKPIEGTRVQLVRSADGKPVTLNSYGVGYGQFAGFTHLNSQAIQLDDAKTDASGGATLRWYPSDTALAIRVLGPGHVPMVHAPVTIGDGNEPITIVVQNGATLRGSLQPLDVLIGLTKNDGDRRVGRPRSGIVLTYRGQGPLQGTLRTKSVGIDAKGEFVVTGLAAGSWELVVRIWRTDAARGAGMSHKKFPPIQLVPGEDRRVELDIRDLRPATLRGRVILNNEARANTQVHLTRITTGPGGQPVRSRATILETNGRGEFVADGIQAGRYTVSVMTARGGPVAPLRLTSRETVEVVAGQTVERTFHIESGRLRVRLIDGAKAPVVGQWLTIHNKSDGFRVSAQTGKDGWLEIAALAVGTYSIGVYPRVKVLPGRLRAPKRNESVDLGKVTVTAGDTATPVTLEMPKQPPR